MGLNDSYKIVRGQILMMKPLPSLSAAYSLIIQEERQRTISIPSIINNDAIAMNVTSESFVSKSKKSLICIHYKKTGHTKSNCYRIIGFPASFKFTKNKKDDPKSSVQNVISTSTSPSITMEQYGHLVQLLNNQNMNSSSSINHISSSVINGAMNDEGNPFSYHHFVANVYKSSSLLHTSFSWIIDSGATDHICSNRDLFLSFTSLNQPHFIGLPDGHHATVSFIGDIQLHDSIILHRVLYVPSFKYNIISIPKFTKHLNTFVIFTDEECLLQDPSSKNEIALGVFGKKVNDLYVIDHRTIKYSLSFCCPFPSRTCFNVINKPSNTLLWHKRLGHLSFSKLKQLSLVPSHCNDFVFDSCLTCSQAKQPCLSFPKSISHTRHPFDLVHIDV